MKLTDSVDQILDKIVMNGGEKYLEQLSIQRLIKGHDFRCPVCRKNVHGAANACLITNELMISQFVDRFDRHECAERGRRWIRHIHECFLEFPKEMQNKILAKDHEALAEFAAKVGTFKLFEKQTP